MEKETAMYLRGLIKIRGNKGYNGGGLALFDSSVLFFSDDLSLFVEDNLAENVGGGLYVQVDCATVCSIITEDERAHVRDYFVEFKNNLAKTAGNDWYGGHFYVCSIYNYEPWWITLADIIPLA